MGLPFHYIFLQVAWPSRMHVFKRSEITRKSVPGMVGSESEKKQLVPKSFNKYIHL